MSNRRALTRHTRRANPHGIPAAELIAAYGRTEPAPIRYETSPLLVPGLLPAPTGSVA